MVHQVRAVDHNHNQSVTKRKHEQREAQKEIIETTQNKGYGQGQRESDRVRGGKAWQKRHS